MKGLLVDESLLQRVSTGVLRPFWRRTGRQPFEGGDGASTTARDRRQHRTGFPPRPQGPSRSRTARGRSRSAGPCRRSSFVQTWAKGLIYNSTATGHSLPLTAILRLSCQSPLLRLDLCPRAMDGLSVASEGGRHNRRPSRTLFLPRKALIGSNQTPRALAPYLR